MNIRIALAGNPNSGKTTLFNNLTQSNQYVGNWPGVTVEKKEGKLRKHNDVTVVDLPGIYSLSPYTEEEVVARNYLLDEKPEVIINIVDGTNLERNLYLSTQLMELGIPFVMALNMMDVVRKNGDRIDTKALSNSLGCPVVEISALRGENTLKVAEEAIKEAQKGGRTPAPIFSSNIEKVISYIEEKAAFKCDESEKRWYAIKVFEGDQKVLEKVKIENYALSEIKKEVENVEVEMDDDKESIITNERYSFIERVVKTSYKKKSNGLTVSDKIDTIVTNKYLALPIFALVMWLVYFVSVSTIGTIFTDWANDGVFGDGFYLLGIGRSAYEESVEEYGTAESVVNAFGEKLGLEAVELDEDSLEDILSSTGKDEVASYILQDEETLSEEEIEVTYTELVESVDILSSYNYSEPEPEEYGPWVPGLPVLIGNGLEAIGCSQWLMGLILDGIVAGVGAVLGFVPQMFVLFLFLAVLEDCGYMARIAFVMDRIFRKFGLSGKSFIPILIGTGCGVPGIMASRTIENEKDRRMTIITTTFIPCGAKLPFIAMIAGSIFGGASWVAPTAYFLGMFAIITSGIILKKTKLFSGDPAPFVMELPSYHMPTVKNVLLSMWERGWSFIKKAGTIILLSTIVVWFTSFFGFAEDGFRMLSEEELDYSILGRIGSLIAWIFYPLGWGNWQAAVASITGLVAKENIVGTLGILYGAEGSAYIGISAAFSKVAGLSFLSFNLLCAPCFAAIGAIKREMNSAKWTWFAVGYQCLFAYLVALVVYQFGSLFTGNVNVLLLFVAILVAAYFLYMLFKKERKVGV